jgi:ATPase subunit of ABC transporter with duplicated ATPase domains
MAGRATHDRCFLNRVADHLLVVEPGRFRIIDGNYETYQYFVRQRLAAPASKATETTRTVEKKPIGPKPKRLWRFPYRKPAEIEVEIMEREGRIAQLQAQLLLPTAVPTARAGVAKWYRGRRDRRTRAAPRGYPQAVKRLGFRPRSA